MTKTRHTESLDCQVYMWTHTMIHTTYTKDLHIKILVHVLTKLKSYQGHNPVVELS